MSPYELEETVRQNTRFVRDGGTHDHAIFNMLKALLQHEADKEARRNLEVGSPQST